jgi:hypothetical protein
MTTEKEEKLQSLRKLDRKKRLRMLRGELIADVRKTAKKVCR